MKSRAILIFAFVSVLCGLLWLAMSGSDTPQGGAGSTNGADSNSAKAADAAMKNSAETAHRDAKAGMSQVDWKQFSDLVNAASVGFKSTPENVARFLEKHGETAVNLIAVFENTGDQSFLDRALQLFPNSPVVLMAALGGLPQKYLKPGERSEPDAERLALIERLKAADPNNPLAWIYSARELFKPGPNDAAIAEIRAALDRPAFYIYSSERMNAMQRLLEENGLHPTAAGLAAMAGLRLPHMSDAMQSSRMLNESHEKARNAGDLVAADEALRLNYGLGRMFATPEASRLLIGELVSYSIESRALNALPPGTRPEWLNVDPARRLAEIEKQKQIVKSGTPLLTDIIVKQDEPALLEYLRRMRTESESSAMQWLMKSRGK